MRVVQVLFIAWSLCAFRYVTTESETRVDFRDIVNRIHEYNHKKRNDEQRNSDVAEADPTTAADAKQTIDPTLRTSETLRIPRAMYAVVKPISGGEQSMTYVDRVYYPGYYEVKMSPDDWAQCGAFDLEMFTDYCDCREVCRNHGEDVSMRPTAFRQDYRLTYYADSESVYFTTKPTGPRVVPNFDGTRWFGDHVTGKTFGPFRSYKHSSRSGGSASADPQSLLDERVLTEWAAYVNTYEYDMRFLLWEMGRTRQVSQPDEDKPQLHPNEDDTVINVTFSPEYNVSFGRPDCLPLMTGNFSSDRVIVNSGGCVRVYNGRHCTGSSRMVVQNRVGFYAEDKAAARRPVLRHVKSVSACCGRSAVPSATHESSGLKTILRINDHNGQLVENRCNCSCSTLNLDHLTTDALDMPDEAAQAFYSRPSAVAGLGYRDPYQKTNLPSTPVLLELCNMAFSSLNAIKEKTVAAATANTPSKAVAAVNAISDESWYTVGVAAGVLTQLDSLPLIEDRSWAKTLEHVIVGIMNNLIDMTEIDPVIPEMASVLSVNMALNVWNLEAFMWEVYELSLNNGTEPKRNRESRMKRQHGRDSRESSWAKQVKDFKGVQYKPEYNLLSRFAHLEGL